MVTADLDVGTRPLVVLKSLSVTESGGSNNDGRVEQGEEGDLHLQLENIHPTDGVNLDLSVTSLAPGAVGNVSTPFSIDGLSQDTLTFQRFLSVDQTFVPREAEFAITVSAPEDTLRYLLKAVVGYPALLLIDRDTTNENIAEYFRTAADACGAFHETFRAEGPSLSSAAIDKRDVIIYFTGRRKSETFLILCNRPLPGSWAQEKVCSSRVRTSPRTCTTPGARSSGITSA